MSNILAPGTLELDGNDETIGSLTGALGSIVTNGSANGAELTTNTGDNTIFAGVIQDGGSGAMQLVKAGTGELTLSGVNTYTGSTVINDAGGLIIGGSGQLDGGDYAGNITIDDADGFFEYASSADQTFSGTISGAGSYEHTGSGEVTLTGANSLADGWEISSGKVILGGDDDENNRMSGTITISGTGTLRSDASETWTIVPRL